MVIVVLVVVLLVIVAVVAILAWLSRPVDDPVNDEATYRAAAELHAIRRRLDVARLRAEARADAVRLRRELSDELDDVDPSGRTTP